MIRIKETLIKALRILKTLLVLILLCTVLGICLYAYGLRKLAMQGNKIFAQRCTTVNPQLIGYKNNFLQFSQCVNNPNSCEDDVAGGYFVSYMKGLSKYTAEEKKWLETQNEFINRWEFKLLAPEFLKQASSYQTQMYQAYYDDAQALVNLMDQKTPLPDSFDPNTVREERLRRFFYQNLFNEKMDEIGAMNDHRILIINMPVPKECNDSNIIIPETAGAIDWGTEESSTSAQPIDVNIYNGPIS